MIKLRHAPETLLCFLSRLSLRQTQPIELRRRDEQDGGCIQRPSQDLGKHKWMSLSGEASAQARISSVPACGCETFAELVKCCSLLHPHLWAHWGQELSSCWKWPNCYTHWKNIWLRLARFWQTECALCNNFNSLSRKKWKDVTMLLRNQLSIKIKELLRRL